MLGDALCSFNPDLRSGHERRLDVRGRARSVPAGARRARLEPRGSVAQLLPRRRRASPTCRGSWRLAKTSDSARRSDRAARPATAALVHRQRCTAAVARRCRTWSAERFYEVMHLLKPPLGAVRSRISRGGRPATSTRDRCRETPTCRECANARRSALLPALGGAQTVNPSLRQRQRAHAMAGRGEDRVADRRRDRRQRRLADAGRRVVALDEVHVDLRRVRDAQQRIAVEVRLLDAAVLDRDLQSQRRAEAVDRPSLRTWFSAPLMLTIGPMSPATVTRCSVELAIRVDADLGDFGEVAGMTEVEREPEPATLRQRSCPSPPSRRRA